MRTTMMVMMVVVMGMVMILPLYINYIIGLIWSSIFYIVLSCSAFNVLTLPHPLRVFFCAELWYLNSRWQRGFCHMMFSWSICQNQTSKTGEAPNINPSWGQLTIRSQLQIKQKCSPVPPYLLFSGSQSMEKENLWFSGSKSLTIITHY